MGYFDDCGFDDFTHCCSQIISMLYNRFVQFFEL
nr:MAG TPA: hypothetical protein [Caudoviricetes sp.]